MKEEQNSERESANSQSQSTGRQEANDLAKVAAQTRNKSSAENKNAASGVEDATRTTEEHEGEGTARGRANTVNSR